MEDDDIIELDDERGAILDVENIVNDHEILKKNYSLMKQKVSFFSSSKIIQTPLTFSTAEWSFQDDYNRN